MNKPVVLHLTSLTGGGAGQYTMGIHQNMVRDGYDSYVCARGEQLILPTGEVVAIHHKKGALWSRFKRYVLKRIIARSGGVDSKYAPFSLYEHLDFYNPKDLLRALPQKPTHIMVHWVSGYANARYVRTLQELTGAKVYYWMIDEACLAGGCHYPWDCEGYKTGCKDCPMTKSRIIKHAIQKNFLHKQRYIPADAEVVVPTEMDRIRLEQSLLWKGHPWHKMIEIVNEEIFYPIEDAVAQKKELGLPVDKRLILFGSANLSEERKGMKVLIAALQKIEREDLVCVVIGSQDELDIKLPNIRLGRVDIPILAKLYRAVDVFVCPSLEDSGPQMINQSIMSGTPVVAFEMGVALDIVKTGKTGYLAKWNDAEDLANGINYILESSKGDYMKMREHCRRIAIQTFSRGAQKSLLQDIISIKKKVLYVSKNENYGGAARAALRIMRGVQKQGVDAQMFVKSKSSKAEDVISLQQFIPSNPLYKTFDSIVAKIKNQWQHYQWRPYRNREKSVYLSDLCSTCIHNAFIKFDFDIVHLHWINDRFLNIDELKKIKKPIVWTLHDSWPFTSICHVPHECRKYESHCGACPMLVSTEEHDLAYEVFDKKQAVFKGLDLHIVTPSKWIGDCAKRSVLLGQFPVTVIPNCIDTEAFHPMNRKEYAEIINLPPNKKYILFGAMHATTDKNKGFDLLLDALRLLKDINAELIVYGTDEDLSKYDIPMPVHALGYIHETSTLTALYNIADVMAVPSYSEVFGQTASEAMACGTPVVAFRCTGIQEVVEEGCGYLAEPYSAEDLANGIRYCIEHNPDNVLGKTARKSVEKRYAMDVVAEQYKSLYESLCK